MKQRCLNPKNPRWASYGGAGVKLDERWHRFENFVADMGERPEGRTLDRYPDPNGDYNKDNCRWATLSEQQNNRRDTNRLLTYQGKTQTLTQWCRELGFNDSTIAKRIRRGWTTEEALGLTPGNHQRLRESKKAKAHRA